MNRQLSFIWVCILGVVFGQNQCQSEQPAWVEAALTVNPNAMKETATLEADVKHLSDAQKAYLNQSIYPVFSKAKLDFYRDISVVIAAQELYLKESGIWFEWAGTYGYPKELARMHPGLNKEAIAYLGLNAVQGPASVKDLGYLVRGCATILENIGYDFVSIFQ